VAKAVCRSLLVVRVWSAAELERHADDYLEVCFAQKKTPLVNEFAASLKISTHKLSRLFLKLVGEPPSTYLKRKHLERARYLLVHTDLHPKAIALALGFRSETSFYRTFGRITGMTPRAFRKKYKRP
jgi:AraC-like DNA-binding protein